MLNDEIDLFKEQRKLLSDFISELAIVDEGNLEPKHSFLAEAVIFRLFRIYERLVKSAFLYYCVNDTSLAGHPVVSKLRCSAIEDAEEILKAGNKFLDWGNVVSTQKLAGLVFDAGYPITDILSPLHSHLVDLQRFRNFIAHDSREAMEGFQRARGSYIKVGDIPPETVGLLGLYRRSPSSDISLRILFEKVARLAEVVQGI